MCGRFYVDDDTAKEIERTIRKVDEQLKRQQRTGDIYPTQTAAVISTDQKEMAVCSFQESRPRHQTSLSIF